METLSIFKKFNKQSSLINEFSYTSWEVTSLEYSFPFRILQKIMS